VFMLVLLSTERAEIFMEFFKHLGPKMNTACCGVGRIEFSEN
jgi:hypothetical protein